VGRSAALIAATCLLGLWTAVRSEPMPVAVPGDEHDIVLFDQERPFLVRLHLSAGGKAHRAGWDASLQALFHFLDTDGDGVLNEKELARAPSAGQLLQMLRGEMDLEAEPAPDWRVVAGESGHALVTLQQLAAYYSRMSAGALVPEWIAREHREHSISDALFRYLDTDRDGKLSAAELAAAPEVLAKFDSNLDEMISPDEIVTPLPAEPYARRTLQGLEPATPFAMIERGSDLSDTVTRLIDRYDKRKAGGLMRGDIGFDTPTFDRLDANRDNKIDRKELTAWLNGPPDLELVVQFGAGASPPLVSPSGGRFGAVLAAQPTLFGTVVLNTRRTRVDFLARQAETPVAPAGRKQLEALFRNLDANKNNVVERREAFRPPFAIVPFLRMADANGEGQITREEWMAFLDLRDRIVTPPIVMTWLDRDRSLFDFLDADHDGRLSRRELSTARARLAPFARNGGVSRDDLPHQAQVVFQYGRLGDALPSNAVAVANMFGPAVRFGGPLWFRKMDRNRDGYVSPREFLGTAEQFKKIDSDGDGLIDPQEADRADAWYRKEHSPSP
jgi:Ca2+-binding EF-hand superfamily protein